MSVAPGLGAAEAAGTWFVLAALAEAGRHDCKAVCMAAADWKRRLGSMHLDPNRRFQSAAAMQTALQSCLPASANAASTNHVPAASAAPSPGATLIVPVGGKVCAVCGYINR